MFFCCTPSRAADSDVVLSALTDEMDRSMKDLRIDVHPPPYFISYTVKETDDATYSSCLGAPSVFDHDRSRILTPVVRVGNYELDSSYPLSNRPESSFALPLDDNYAAVRRGVWLNTDREYKYAVRVLEWKKAYLSANNVTDRLSDMTHESPVVVLETIKPLAYDGQKWSDEICQLSGLFKNYPTLQKSKVSFIARTVNRWYVNSEGSRLRDSRNQYAVRIWAAAQSADGMPLEDCEMVADLDQSRLPDYDQLKKLTETLAQRLTDLRIAPKGEEYCGPVLFEGQGAAELFSQLLAPNFGFAEEYIGSEDWTNPLKNRLGRKILSKQLSVIDDPLAKDSRGNLLMGAYKYDDDGMPAQKVSIVENGLLKGFCQSRIPTRHCNHTNGHSLGGHGVSSILQLSSTKTSTPEEIKAQITEMGKDAGLDYVLVISRIEEDYQMPEYPSGQSPNKRPYATPSHSIQPSDPLIVHKLYLADGRRELVRGLEFTYVSLRTFRDVQAVGDDAKPYIIEPVDCRTRALITPSFVIGEMELTPVTPEHSTPPILPSPLAVRDGQPK
jgi:hypothetical protein